MFLTYLCEKCLKYMFCWYFVKLLFIPICIVFSKHTDLCTCRVSISGFRVYTNNVFLNRMNSKIVRRRLIKTKNNLPCWCYVKNFTWIK